MDSRFTKISTASNRQFKILEQPGNCHALRYRSVLFTGTGQPRRAKQYWLALSYSFEIDN